MIFSSKRECNMLRTRVRKTPSWPRNWANFSFLSLYSHRNARANLHLLGQPNTFLAKARASVICCCRGTWAGDTVDHFRRVALQTLYGNMLSTNICCAQGAGRGRGRGRRLEALAAGPQAAPGGAARARSHCRFVPPLIHFIPDLLTRSAPLFLKRQCDRTLGAARDGRRERRVRRHGDGDEPGC
jgi:hypothetical protein